MTTWISFSGTFPSTSALYRSSSSHYSFTLSEKDSRAGDTGSPLQSTLEHDIGFDAHWIGSEHSLKPSSALLAGCTRSIYSLKCRLAQYCLWSNELQIIIRDSHETLLNCHCHRAWSTNRRRNKNSTRQVGKRPQGIEEKANLFTFHYLSEKLLEQITSFSDGSQLARKRRTYPSFIRLNPHRKQKLDHCVCLGVENSDRLVSSSPFQFQMMIVYWISEVHLNSIFQVKQKEGDHVWMLQSWYGDKCSRTTQLTPKGLRCAFQAEWDETMSYGIQ